MARKRRIVKRIVKVRKVPKQYLHVKEYPIIEKTCDRDESLVTNNIFYHMFCIGDAIQRFDRTYKKITKSGLLDNIQNIYVNCVGEHKQEFMKNIIHLEKVKPIIGQHDKDESETLNLLREFSIKNPNGNILYLHSKGVTNPRHNRRNSVQSWVDCMEYFLIEEYIECLNCLKEYETCGINYVQFNDWSHRKFKFSHTSHYSGNFWWARCCYLANRPECSNRNRWCAEMEFLQPALSKYKNLYNMPTMSPWRIYSYPVHREAYTDKQALI